MKTDLTKILSIGGQPGLYLYLAQSNGGVVVESLMDKQRKWTGPSARMTALSDISVYTQEEDELPLQDIFIRMKEHLKDAPAPDPRSKDTDMPGFFETVIPEYDRERFYASHMKKVLEWYNVLHAADALDFEVAEEEVKETEEEPAKAATARTTAPAAARPVATKPAGVKAAKPVTKHTTQK